MSGKAAGASDANLLLNHIPWDQVDYLKRDVCNRSLARHADAPDILTEQIQATITPYSMTRNLDRE